VGAKELGTVPTLKPGQKKVQFVLDEESEMHLTLLQWANNRGLTLGKATRVIMADWADAINGRSNPFAAAADQQTQSSPASSVQAQELSEEERKRQALLLQAAEQFL
jgi:hypothetical protein